MILQVYLKTCLLRYKSYENTMQFHSYLITFIIFLNVICFKVDSCSFGSGCTFPCHCEGGDSDCNENGTCTSGTCATNKPPGFDWKGPGCQIGNVAKDKTTYQNGYRGNRYSALAVNGRTFVDSKDNTHCTHTNDKPAWWYVNLGSIHVVYNVTVFNQDAAAYRLANFKVYVGNDTTVANNPECGYYQGTVPQAGSYNISCATVMVGKYVGIQLMSKSDPTEEFLHLCEVVVEGYKYAACNGSKYGPGCVENCDTNCIDGFCNDVIGTCFKCKLGYFSPHCPACNDGKYGQNCSETCGDCIKGDICDKVTGECSKGCQKWYIGDQCKEYLNEPLNPGPIESSLQTAYTITIEWKQYGGVPNGGDKHYKYDVVYRNDQETQSLMKPHVKGQEYQNATVTGLEPETDYEFWIESYREFGNVRDPGWDSEISTFRTKNGSSMTTPANNILPLAAGAGGGGLVLLILIIVVIVIVVKRKKKSPPPDDSYVNVSNNGSSGRAVHFDRKDTALFVPSTSQITESEYAEVNMEEEAPKTVQKETEDENENPLESVGAVYAEVQKKPPKKTKRLKVSELEGYIEAKLREKDGFKNEYTTVPSGPTKACDVGNIEENKNKNRFLNIRAYDHSRVILQKDQGDEYSDYINASFITGYNNSHKAYIATQGPKTKTVKDFWKMIWQVKANRIVMVTNLVEKAKVKCAKYWPEIEGETLKSGIFTIKSTNSEKLANFTTSVLSVKKGKESFLVRHFHFTAWPDHDVPDYATALLDFHHRIRSFDREAKGPLVIHCSAGVGRSGTFIAIDHAIDKAEMEGEVDILGCTRAMREERINMIQTETQYMFVYKAVLEATECGDTTIQSSRIQDTLKRLFAVDPAMKKTPLEHQFQVLQKYRPAIKRKKLVGLQAINENKNRDPLIFPANSLRPVLGELLPTVQGGTDYINATFVDGYEKADAYIMTQMPLPHTIPDLWRLMFDHKLKTIVMLNDTDTKDVPYWPKDDTPLQFGPLQVELVNTENDPSGNVTTRELKISKKGAECVIVKQFSLCSWESGAVPEPSSLLKLMDIVQSWQQQTQNRPVVIHCMNGSDRSGIYCVANYILEQLKINRDFNIYSAIKLMRVARPQIIPSLEQYQFLHNFAVEYIQQNDAYANFKM